MATVMRNVVIERTALNPMQSGRYHPLHWKVSFVREGEALVDPLMGWVGTDDPLTELKLSFERLDEAVHYVTEKGWDYKIRDCPEPPVLRVKRYSDNFVLPRQR